MSEERKKKNESPASNYKEKIPADKADPGNKAVVKPEDLVYHGKNPEFPDPAKQREQSEQPPTAHNNHT